VGVSLFRFGTDLGHGGVNARSVHGDACRERSCRRAGGEWGQSGAVFPNQGRAVSSCPASWKSVASAPILPTNCRPIGRPPELQASGTVIAGWPELLKAWVLGM